MKKKYIISANGDIKALKFALSKLDCSEIGSLDNFVNTAIPIKRKDVFEQADKLFIEYSKKFNFSFSYGFAAYNIKQSDLENADAVELTLDIFGENNHGRYSGGLQIENNNFSYTNICNNCNEKKISFLNSGSLEFNAKNNFSFPYFETTFGGIVFREDVFEQLKKYKSSSVYINECKIRTTKTIREKYFSVFPKIDLGEPVEDMEYLDPCPGCNIRRIRHKKEFLFCFNKKLFNNHHIAWTSWYSLGKIIVSTDIYKILREYPEGKKNHDKYFEPIELR